MFALTTSKSTCYVIHPWWPNTLLRLPCLDFSQPPSSEDFSAADRGEEQWGAAAGAVGGGAGFQALIGVDSVVVSGTFSMYTSKYVSLLARIHETRSSYMLHLLVVGCAFLLQYRASLYWQRVVRPTTARSSMIQLQSPME